MKIVLRVSDICGMVARLSFNLLRIHGWLAFASHCVFVDHESELFLRK